MYFPRCTGKLIEGMICGLLYTYTAYRMIRFVTKDTDVLDSDGAVQSLYQYYCNGTGLKVILFKNCIIRDDMHDVWRENRKTHNIH
jgi:hypothetical protein